MWGFQYVCMYIYIYINIYRDTDTDRGRDRGRDTDRYRDRGTGRGRDREIQIYIDIGIMCKRPSHAWKCQEYHSKLDYCLEDNREQVRKYKMCKGNTCYD